MNLAVAAVYACSEILNSVPAHSIEVCLAWQHLNQEAIVNAFFFLTMAIYDPHSVHCKSATGCETFLYI